MIIARTSRSTLLLFSKAVVEGKYFIRFDPFVTGNPIGAGITSKPVELNACIDLGMCQLCVTNAMRCILSLESIL